MDEHEIRAALDRHWAASDANDFDAEHDIYREDALLEYPQSGERIRGRRNIQASRVAQPNSKRFRVRRIVGTLLLVGRGAMSPSEMDNVIQRKRRSGFSAPPQGLTLMEIKYA